MKLQLRATSLGIVPCRPFLRADGTVGMRHGKVRPGTVFTLDVDPKKPPRWCEPVDDEGRDVYRNAYGGDFQARLRRPAVEPPRMVKAPAPLPAVPPNPVAPQAPGGPAMPPDAPAVRFVDPGALEARSGGLQLQPVIPPSVDLAGDVSRGDEVSAGADIIVPD